MTVSASVDSAVRAVAPIVGVSIGRQNDKSTWRIDFSPEATQEQRAAAANVVTSFDSAAVDAAEQAELSAVESLDVQSKTDPIYTAMSTATDAQINTFINNAFPAMTVQQRAVIKFLVRYIVSRIRRGL